MVEKTQNENFNFVPLLFILLFANVHHENYTVYANIRHTKRLLYYRACVFSGLGDMNYD